MGSEAPLYLPIWIICGSMPSLSSVPRKKVISAAMPRMSISPAGSIANSVADDSST